MPYLNDPTDYDPPRPSRPSADNDDALSELQQLLSECLDPDTCARANELLGQITGADPIGMDAMPAILRRPRPSNPGAAMAYDRALRRAAAQAELRRAEAGAAAGAAALNKLLPGAGDRVRRIG